MTREHEALRGTALWFTIAAMAIAIAVGRLVYGGDVSGATLVCVISLFPAASYMARWLRRRSLRIHRRT